MIRISKLADYSMVIVGWLAQQKHATTVEHISAATRVPLATVRKLTRILTQAGLCQARKGPHGGYRLAAPAEQISLLRVIEAVEGEMAVTECALNRHCECSLIDSCSAKPGWQVINQTIRNMMSSLSIADLMHENINESAVIDRLSDFNAGVKRPVGMATAPHSQP